MPAAGDPLGTTAPPRAAAAPPATAATTPPVEQAKVPVSAIKTQTPEQAALLALTPLSPTNTIELRPAYTTIRPDGQLGDVDLRLGLWMPYVLLPGIAAPRMGSLIVMDLHFQTLHAPMVDESGIGDFTFIDLAVYEFGRFGVGLGFTAVLPSATSPALGTGKLQLGPTAVFGAGGSHLAFTLTFINVFSVAGEAARPDTDTLVVLPTLGYLLPKAFFLRFDPVWTFEWKRAGFATIPVNLAAGHAFTSHLLVFVQPEWVTTGTLKNSFTVRAGLTYLGW
jgi:hypothetical protein